MVETPFYQSLPCFLIHKKGDFKGGYVEEKLAEKKLQRKNPMEGGHICPPPLLRVTRVNVGINTHIHSLDMLTYCRLV